VGKRGKEWIVGCKSGKEWNEVGRSGTEKRILIFVW